MSGSRLEIGLVLPTLEKPQSDEKSQWPNYQDHGSAGGGDGLRHGVDRR